MQRSFSPQPLVVAIVVPVMALIAGCGSSKHATTSRANPTAPLPASSTATGGSPTPSTPKTTTTPPSTGPTTAQPGAKTTTTSNPTGGAGLPGGGGSGSGGSTNARVPATFTIASGGRLSPPLVSVPAFLAVQLTVVSHDGKPHQVLLRTPTARSLAVPAQGHASVLIPGLRAGRYPLQIDGAPRGALSIGGEPGP